MIQPIEDTIPHLTQHILHDDLGTLVAEVGAALVPGPGWKEGSVMREDLEGDHLKLFKDAHHHMEHFLVQRFAKACPKIGERSFTGQILQMEAGISSVGPSHVFIPQQGKDVITVEVSVEVAKQIDQEKTGRIIARRAAVGVAVSDQAANEGKIDQRGNHFGIATPNGAIREDLYESFVESVG